MKIIVEDFKYKGRHFEYFEADWPGVDVADDIPEENIIDYIKESLDDFIEGEES